ncbi:MAG TPA: hypothetical protein VK581_05725 [Chthoniobacterales bacterium]|nr:hypothetical protein [Chthoniobacterales bacterium]
MGLGANLHALGTDCALGEAANTLEKSSYTLEEPVCMLKELSDAVEERTCTVEERANAL